MKTDTHAPRRLHRAVRLAVLLALCIHAPTMAAESAQPPQYEPVRPVLGKALIFGSDNRTAIADTSRYPFSAVGRVLAFYGNEALAGTGAVIGDNIVLTAAHVVFDRELGAADSIQFIPGADGESQPFGTATVTRVRVPEQWTRSGDESFDVAVLTLDREVGGQTGTFPFSVVSSSSLEGQTLQSAGYPSDLDEGNTMYSAPGLFLGIDGNMLLEEIDTEPGQSGSPIWLQSGNNITLVATLVGTREGTDSGGQTIAQGVGVYISPEIFSWTNASISSSSGDNVPAGPQCGTCGAGTGQAVLGISLGWTACLVSRRSRR